MIHVILIMLNTVGKSGSIVVCVSPLAITLESIIQTLGIAYVTI